MSIATTKGISAKDRAKGKNCLREWVVNPKTDRWIQVEGDTWDELMLDKKYQTILPTLERRTTPGKLKGGICVPPQGDPPHGGRGHSPGRGIGHRGSSPGRGYGHRGYSRYHYPRRYGGIVPFGIGLGLGYLAGSIPTRRGNWWWGPPCYGDGYCWADYGY